MKKLLILALLAAFSLSCGKQEEGKTTLVFWEFWTADIIDPVIAKFEEENPDIKIEKQQLTWQDGFDKILIAIASGSAPDVLELGSTWAPKFVKDGTLEDLTNIFGKYKDKLVLWEPVTYNNRIFGIPWVIGTRIIFYNKELFRKAGLDENLPPATWEELYEYSKKIHNPKKGIYGFGLNAGERYILFKKFMPFSYGNGGRILSEDMTKSVLYSEENVSALKYYVMLKDCGIVDKQAMLDSKFREGKIGIVISGGWNFKTIPVESPQLDYGTAVIPKPSAENGVNASFGGGEVIVIPKGTKKLAPALRFAEFLIREDNQITVCRTAKHCIPSFKGAENNAYYVSNPKEAVMVEQLKTAFTTPCHPQWNEIEAIVDEAVEMALYGKSSPEDALRKASEKIDIFLKENR